MEKYEIANESASSSAKILDNSKKYPFLTSNGLLAYTVEQDEDKQKIGLNHNFKKLSDEDNIMVDQLFIKRESLIQEFNKLDSNYNDVYSLIKPIIDELNSILEKEDTTLENFNTVNRKICAIQGHRLGEKIEVDDDNYSYRECLCCGAHIFPNTITDNDVVVKEKENNPVKTLVKSSIKNKIELS